VAQAKVSSVPAGHETNIFATASAPVPPSCTRAAEQSVWSSVPTVVVVPGRPCRGTAEPFPAFMHAQSANDSSASRSVARRLNGLSKCLRDKVVERYVYDKSSILGHYTL